jgi:hypothetical protein
MNSVNVLRDLVRLGGFALHSEDCALRASFHLRGEFGGLDRMQNERYHQFIIWRAILSAWDAEIERHGRTDIIVRRNIENVAELHHFELKNWRGETGNGQIPKIQRDVPRAQRWERGYVLITSINPPHVTDKNLDDVPKEVHGLLAAQRQDFRFATEGRKGEPLEFWLAGWPVLPQDSNVPSD